MSEKEKNVADELGQQAQDTGGQGEERDKLDELLADVPEWLRGPLKENYKQILVSLAIIVLSVSLWSGYSYYTTRQEESASYHLGIAMSKSDIDGRIKELKDLTARFSHTSAARLAKLLLGQAYLEKGDWKAASGTFDSCVSEYEGALLDTALMGHGYALEEEKNLDKALSDYIKAGDANRGFEAVALIDKARVLSEKGKKKEALEAYSKYLDLKPESPFLDFIRYEILKLS